MLVWYEILGVLGLTGIGTLYILESLNKLKRHHGLYVLGNSLSSFLLAVYAYYIDSYVFLVLNMLIFIGGLVSYFRNEMNKGD